MLRIGRLLRTSSMYASAYVVGSSVFDAFHMSAAFLFHSKPGLSHFGPDSGCRASLPLMMAQSFVNEKAVASMDEEDKKFSNQGQTQQEKILPFIDSSHNSATISIPSEEEHDILFRREEFSRSLIETVKYLREMKKTSVWVEVPMSKAGFIEDIEAADLGFEFHHAEGKTVKLNAWLRQDIVSKIPEYATHHVGVGAVVISSKDEILCIRELRKNYHPWKIPTGLAELGESIDDAVEREVFEETGITASCQNILAFRHTHGMANGRSDLFFICQLKPEEDSNGNVETPTPQACEISEAKWLPISEYRDMVDGKTDESNGHPVMTFVMNHILDKDLQISMKTVNSVVPGRSPTPLYFPKVNTS